MGPVLPFKRKRRRRRARRWRLRRSTIFFVSIAALWLAFEFSGFSLPSASGADVVGRATVIDGDTIEIRGERIRLHGIDAPESAQWCRAASGTGYRCGQRAATALSREIGARNVRCEVLDRDRYGRHVARCFLDDTDLNEWLVSEGLAVAYRQFSWEYLPAETLARVSGTGIWQGEFDLPWEWRRGNRRIGEGGRRQ